MPFTTQQIVDAVNGAGFESIAEFGAFLSIGRKQIQIAKLELAAKKVEDARKQANKDANDALVEITAQKQAVEDELKALGG